MRAETFHVPSPTIFSERYNDKYNINVNGYADYLVVQDTATHLVHFSPNIKSNIHRRHCLLGT